MISQVKGVLVQKEIDRVEILTAGGVAYEVAIPLAVFEALPDAGGEATLHTHLVVRDDGWQLFGFSSLMEKRVFQRLLTASGVGPSMALGMISALSAERVVRAVRERDVATLQRAPRVGRKTAERIILDLAERIDALVGVVGEGGARVGGVGGAADDAVRALVALGYSAADAERSVRGTVEENGASLGTGELVRRAIARLSARG